MRFAEGHAMTDTAMVPRKNDGPPPLIDQQLPDDLLGRAQAEASSYWVRTGLELR